MVLNFGRIAGVEICLSVDFRESNRSAKAQLSWSRAGSWFRLVDILDLPEQLPLAYSWTNGHTNDFVLYVFDTQSC